VITTRNARRSRTQADARYGDKREGDQKEKQMQKYECTVCGYVYDPMVGDPENGVPANTAFEDLPPDWVCPECGAEKDMFEPAK